MEYALISLQVKILCMWIRERHLLKDLIKAYRTVTKDDAEPIVMGEAYAKSMDNIVAFGLISLASRALNISRMRTLQPKKNCIKAKRNISFS